MARWLRIAVCLAAFVGFPASAAASPTDPETVSEVVSAVEQTYQGVTTIRADFTQVVKNVSMGTEDRQRGRLTLERPRKLRVELGAPVQSAVVSDGKTLWVYSVKSKSVVETPELGGGAGMGVLLDDLTQLDELFDVSLVVDKTKPSHTVRLVPKQPGQFKSLVITVSKQKYLLQELVLVDQMDNQTQMSFQNIRLNQDVPDSEFVFVAPAGVQVIKTGP